MTLTVSANHWATADCVDKPVSVDAAINVVGLR
jgi:hypothetical protein